MRNEMKNMVTRSMEVRHAFDVLSCSRKLDRTELYLSQDQTILLVEFHEEDETFGNVTDYVTFSGSIKSRRKAARKVYMAYTCGGLPGLLALVEIATNELRNHLYMQVMNHRLEVVK